MSERPVPGGGRWADLLADAEDVPVTAGVVVETVPGGAGEVRSRLSELDGVEVVGDDGGQRLAAVWRASNARRLIEQVERLVAADESVLGVFPTFFGREDGVADDAEG